MKLLGIRCVSGLHDVRPDAETRGENSEPVEPRLLVRVDSSGQGRLDWEGCEGNEEEEDAG